MTITASFIGLGVMGYPMAGHLAQAGLRVKVWNRTPSKCQQWLKDYSGTACASIAEAVGDADFVLTCVGADKDLIEVFEGPDGIIANAPRGATLIDHTTASAEVAQAASKAAVIAEVRQALVDFQRSFARRAGGAVLDGRDIGTVICPDAEVKLFVTADAETRARRRWEELRARGEMLTFDEMLAQTLERDRRDAGRADAPMRAAEDATLLDTSSLSIDAAVATAIRIVENRQKA